MLDRSPLWIRLGVAFGLGSLLILAATLMVVNVVTSSAVETQAINKSRLTAQALAADVDGFFGGRGIAPISGLGKVERLLATRGERVGLIDLRGTPRGFAARLLDPDQMRTASKEALDGVSSNQGRQYGFHAEPVSNGQMVSIIVAREVASDVPVASVGIPLAIILSLASFVLAAVISRRLTQPLAKLKEAAGKVSHGDFSVRVQAEGSGELSALGQDFDVMASRLQEGRRREQEFLANISHELKTPTTAILGYAEALKDGTVSGPEKTAEASRIISSEAQRLGSLVDEVMSLARMSVEGFSMNMQETDLGAVASKSVEALRPVAERAGVRLEVSEAASVPALSDPGKLQQVVSNLVANALQVTETDGSVSVKVLAESDGGGTIEVADTGPGIAQEDLPHVFERSYLFNVAEREGAPRRSGLGLAIVRELCEKLGCRVTVSSALGVGTVFRVAVPERSLGSAPQNLPPDEPEAT